VQEAVFREMLRPIEEQPLPPAWKKGPYLTIGVEAKYGINWEDLQKLKTPNPKSLGLDLMHYLPDSLAFDRTYFPPMEDEEEDVADLGIVVH